MKMKIEPAIPLENVKVGILPSKALAGQTPQQMQLCITYMEDGNREIIFVPMGTLMFTRQLMKNLFEGKAHYVVVDKQIVPHFFFSKEEALSFSIPGSLKVETLTDYVDSMITTDRL